MTDKRTVVAINGSPHEGIGNTSQLIGMLSEDLDQRGTLVEEVLLNRHYVKYCTGCAMCLEKGVCWIKDDHKGLTGKLLAADAVILASPVYFFHVTAQMKTFLDRSVGLGHRPQATWKPGIAVSVSAGYGETSVARYLADVLRVYGAYPVGELTAIATGPGEFLGKEAVRMRAGDLARDLTNAMERGVRYPATERDLTYWNFIGHLIRSERDFMKADFAHWEQHGLFQSFEKYVGQERAAGIGTPETYRAWLNDVMQRSAGEREARPEGSDRSGQRDSPRVATMRELLEMMPQAFNSHAAGDLSATYQFNVTGSEDFTAHLIIENGTCKFVEGPASDPGVTIITPPEVWLAVSRGEMDGQSAFLSGKYRAEGDLGLLMKLKSLFSSAA